MLKIIISISFFLLYSTSIYTQDVGQKIYFEEQVKLKGKGVSYFLNAGDSSKLLVIDSDFVRVFDFKKKEIVATFENENRLHKLEIVGFSLADGISLFVSESKNVFKTVYLDPNKDAAQLRPMNFGIPKDEYFLNCFSAVGKFFILTVSKNSSKLNFYSFYSSYQYEKKSVDVNIDRLSEKLAKKTTIPGSLDLSKAPSLPLIKSSDIEYSDTKALSKVFLLREEIKISLDHEANSTKVITVSLLNFTSKFQSILQMEICNSRGFYSSNNSNSIISEKAFYNVKVCKDQIIVGIFTHDKSFLNKIQIVGDSIFNSKEHDVRLIQKDQLEQKIRLMSKLDVGIVAQEGDSSVLFTVGGLKEYATSTVPNVNISSTLPGMSYNSEKSTAIQFVLGNGIGIGELKADDSRTYKLGVRRRGLEKDFARFIYSFSHEKKLHICYYDFNTKTFAVERFE